MILFFSCVEYTIPFFSLFFFYEFSMCVCVFGPMSLTQYPVLTIMFMEEDDG